MPAAVLTEADVRQALHDALAETALEDDLQNAYDQWVAAGGTPRTIRDDAVTLARAQWPAREGVNDDR